MTSEPRSATREELIGFNRFKLITENISINNWPFYYKQVRIADVAGRYEEAKLASVR